ncbi:hypothetical protein CO115_01505, partial [Candidatus Falkowbacteria bacterium CG_4_9_14_3_um_filter_36_9]
MIKKETIKNKYIGKKPSVKLEKYLNKIKHQILEHKTVYTAFDAASTMHKKLSEIAKSLLVTA